MPCRGVDEVKLHLLAGGGRERPAVHAVGILDHAAVLLVEQQRRNIRGHSQTPTM